MRWLVALLVAVGCRSCDEDDVRVTVVVGDEMGLVALPDEGDDLGLGEVFSEAVGHIRQGLDLLGSASSFLDVFDVEADWSQGGHGSVGLVEKEALAEVLLAVGARLCVIVEETFVETMRPVATEKRCVSLGFRQGVEVRVDDGHVARAWVEAAERDGGSRATASCDARLRRLALDCGSGSGCAPSSPDDEMALAALAAHEDGCWIIFEPNEKIVGGGGLKLLHMVAGLLLGFGRCVRMVYVRPQFARYIHASERVVTAVNMTNLDFFRTRFPLRRGDTLVAPETAVNFFSHHHEIEITSLDGSVERQLLDDDYVERSLVKIEEEGGVVARYCMALQPTMDKHTRAVSVHLGISDYLHRAFAGSGPWAEGPVHPTDGVLEAARAWDATPARERLAAKRSFGPTSRLVVLDDDMPFLDFDAFNTLLLLKAENDSFVPVAKLFYGYSRREAFDLMRAATVYVDGNMVGLESGVDEFSLFGATPLITDVLVGSEHSRVFPRLPPTSRAEPYADAVLDVLRALEAGTVFVSDEYRRRALRYKAGGSAWFADVWRQYDLSRRTMFVFLVQTVDDWRHVGAYASSLFARHAFSRLVVLARNVDEVESGNLMIGAALRQAMNRTGVLSRLEGFMSVDVEDDPDAPYDAEDVLRRTVDHYADLYDFVHVATRRPTAPTAGEFAESLGRVPPSGGCSPPKHGLALCRAEADPALASRLSRSLRADSRDPDCDALRQHGLFMQFAAVMMPYNARALDAFCDASPPPLLHPEPRYGPRGS